MRGVDCGEAKRIRLTRGYGGRANHTDLRHSGPINNSISFFFLPLSRPLDSALGPEPVEGGEDRGGGDWKDPESSGIPIKYDKSFNAHRRTIVCSGQADWPTEGRIAGLFLDLLNHWLFPITNHELRITAFSPLK